MPIDWYPSSMASRAAWHQNFSRTIQTIGTKYGLTPEQITQVAADAEWIAYWVQARQRAASLVGQLSRYFNDIAGTDSSLDSPLPISFGLNGVPPPEVPPGIEARVREIVRQIKGHSGYSAADGELLGIVGRDDRRSLSDMTPKFQLKSLGNFKLEARFRKNGADALRIEFRLKDSPWEPIAFLTKSPGVFAIPQVGPAAAVQVELRAAFIKKNEITGSYSAIQTAFTGP